MDICGPCPQNSMFGEKQFRSIANVAFILPEYKRSLQSDAFLRTGVNTNDRYSLLFENRVL